MNREADFIPIDALKPGIWDAETEDIRKKMRKSLPDHADDKITSGAIEEIIESTLTFRQELLNAINKYGNSFADALNKDDTAFEISYTIGMMMQIYTGFMIRAIDINKVRGLLDSEGAMYLSGINSVMSMAIHTVTHNIATKIATGESREEFQELLDKLFNDKSPE